MKTTKNFFTYGLLIFAMVFTSCSKDGEVGPQGVSGTNGIDGVTGTDGTNGIDGADGTNGTNGEEGNANVETIIFLEPTWDVNYMDLIVPSITQDVADYYVILGYVETTEGAWYSADNFQAYNDGYFRSYYIVGGYSILAYNNDNSVDMTPETMSRAKIIIIEPSNVILAAGNGKSPETKLNFRKKVLEELSNANVDINDYYAVCVYYNISPE